MKKLATVCLLFLLLSCKKEQNSWITGTVTDSQGCNPNSWLVTIDNPHPARHAFLCDYSRSSISSAITNCGNSVIILNLPPSLAQPGTRIKFSKWENKGLLCFSSTLAPNHLEVSDIRAK